MGSTVELEKVQFLIRNCTFFNSTVLWYIWCTNGNFVIRNCTFSNSTVLWYIWCTNGNFVIRNCTFFQFNCTMVHLVYQWKFCDQKLHFFPIQLYYGTFGVPMVIL